MVYRTQFVKKIRELDFKFKRRTKSDKSEMYRQRGGTKIKYVPRSDILDEIYVRNSLSQCGCSEEGINDFLKSD